MEAEGTPLLDCPDVAGLLASARQRLMQMDWPQLEEASYANQIPFTWSRSDSAWAPRATALAWPRMTFPRESLEEGVMARCAVGGFPQANGVMAEARVACVTGYPETHHIHRDFVREAERFASGMRVLSDEPRRCHTLPIVFQLEGFEAPARAPDSAELCPES